MKKFAIVTMMFLLALSASSFATQTRTEVMGFNDGIMVDDYNIFRFPGRTFNYPNLVTGEFSVYNYYYVSEAASAQEEPVGAYQEFYNFGVNWQFGEENPWVLGTYISTVYPMQPEDYWGNGLWEQNMGLGQNRRIQLVYGRQLGGNNFGFGFEYIRSSQERDNAQFYIPGDSVYSTDVSKEAFGYYKFSLGLTEGTSGKWDVAATVGFGTWTDEDYEGFKQTEPDGYLDLTIEGRYFWQHSPKLTFVPHGGFAIGKRGVKDYGYYTDPSDTVYYDTDNWKEKNTLFAFEGGMGMHYTSGPDLLAVLDVGFRYAKIKSEGDFMTPREVEYPTSQNYSDKYLSLPYIKIGFEGSVFKWMDVRFGATSYWNIDKSEDEYTSGSTWIYSYNYTYKEVWNETYLGFGFHWNRLHIDVMTDPDVFLRGFNFISGDSPRIDRDYYYYYEDYGYMNTKMSVLYEMF